MTDETLAPGARFADFRIERHVASGGMGEVYEATQLVLDRRVALKLIASQFGDDPAFRERFRREARTAASIDHTNILTVYDAGEDDQGRLFLSTRFIDGPDLSALLREKGRLGASETVSILGQVAEALDAAHSRGLIHRDVKPANVMLESTGAGWHAYLTDFGLAKAANEKSQHTVTGEILGTFDYMAPEMINGGHIDSRVDVYSFGCMVYRCLTGVAPYARDSGTATMVAHVNEPVPLPSQAVAGVPAVLDAVVQHAMEKDPAKRPASAGELMRWAQAQLTASGDTATVSDQTVSVASNPVTPAGDRAPTGAPAAAVAVESKPRRPFLVTALIHIAVYAPLWGGAYVAGRLL